jgi:hypothetical protein
MIYLALRLNFIHCVFDVICPPPPFPIHEDFLFDTERLKCVELRRSVGTLGS